MGAKNKMSRAMALANESWPTAEVERAVGVDRSTLFRWYTTGKFPKPHYIGTRRYWSAASVLAWVAAQNDPRAAHRRTAHLNQPSAA